MKSRAKLGMLILSLTVLAGAWLLAEYMSGAFAPRQSLAVSGQGSRFYLSVGSPAQMSALSWSYDGQSVNLKRDDTGKWVSADDRACPIDSAKAEALALAVASATADMAIRGVTDFSQYGLDDPALVIMAAAGEEVASFELGSMSITGQNYLRRNGEDTVYLENGTLAPAFRVRLEDILALETLPEDIALVTGIAAQTEAGTYAFFRTGAGPWQVTAGEEAPQPVRDEKARAVYEPVLDLALTDCRTWNAARADQYGLDEPQGTVSVTYITDEGEEKSFSLEFGSYDGSGVFARLRGSRMVYLVPGTVLDGLMYPDWEALLPRTVLPIEPESVAAIDLVLDGVGHHIDCLRNTEEENGEVIYSLNGWILDGAMAEKWLRALTELTADSPAPAAAEGRRPLLSVTITWGDDTGRPATLELRGYDSVHHLCVTDGDRRLLVPRDTADALVALTEELVIAE